MIPKTFHPRRLVVALAAALPMLAIAAPADNSPYKQDAQNTYVHDASTRGIGVVNMITCLMSALKADVLVNEGRYLALVDEKKCSSDRDSASQSSNTTDAPAYIQAIVESSRTTNDQPMRMKAWFTMQEETPDGPMSQTIYIHLEASSAPTESNPYGVFRIDYCGKADGGPDDCMMNGYLSGGADGITFYEREPGRDEQGQPQNNAFYSKALRLVRNGPDDGAGRLNINEGQTPEVFDFAFNGTHFRRRTDDANDYCFSRSEADASNSVWRYGLYDNDNGARIDVNSGFPIEFQRNGETVRGYIGYWGLQVPGDAPADNSTVTRVEHGGQGAVRTDYRYAGKAGRLVRYAKVEKHLSEVQGVKLSVWLNDRSLALGGNDHSSGQIELAWNGSAFAVVGVMNCGDNGCVSADVADVAPMPVSAFNQQGGVRGWSQALGGEVFIPVGSSVTTLAGTAPVLLREQSLVYPDQMEALGNLECLSNCPTPESIAAFVGQTANTPFGSTAFQWAPVSTAVTYTLAEGTLTFAGTAVTATSGLGSRPEYQHGLRSGRLFPATQRSELSCGEGFYCDNKIEDLANYYVWETGPNAWNQFAGLKNGSGAFITFDPPKNVDYDVPAGQAYGAYAGRSLVLQYSGFGQLWGIPGHCVDARSNAPVSCGGNDHRNIRYVPAFSIPFEEAAAGRVQERLGGGATANYLVKWLDKEQRFARVDVNASQCQALNLTQFFTLPSADGLRNTSQAVLDGTPWRIGTKPTLAADTAPRVIHGEVQY